MMGNFPFRWFNYETHDSVWKKSICSKDAINFLPSAHSAHSHFSVHIKRSHRTTVARHASLFPLHSAQENKTKAS